MRFGMSMLMILILSNLFQEADVLQFELWMEEASYLIKDGRVVELGVNSLIYFRFEDIKGYGCKEGIWQFW